MSKSKQTGGRPVQCPLALLLRLTGMLRAKVRRFRGSVRSTSMSSGRMRVAVGSQPGMDGFTAFVDVRDKSMQGYSILRQASGATAEEALANLEDGLRQEAGRGTS